MHIFPRMSSTATHNSVHEKKMKLARVLARILARVLVRYIGILAEEVPECVS